MFGELTDKDTIKKVEEALEKQSAEQFEILIYKKNSKYREKKKLSTWLLKFDALPRSCRAINRVVKLAPR